MLRVFLFIILGTPSLWAEHRIYQLKITDTRTQKSREVLSTLMPKEWVFYNPITAFETVVIVDHWMCWKRSDGYKKPCPRPIASSVQSPKTGSAEPSRDPALNR